MEAELAGEEDELVSFSVLDDNFETLVMQIKRRIARSGSLSALAYGYYGKLRDRTPACVGC